MSTLQTLDRGLEAIEIISRRTGGISPAELADQLGVHRAGAYRILATLQNRRLATKGHDGLYRLGTGALVVAGRFMNQYRTAAQPVVQELADRSSCTAFVAIADQAESVAIAVAEPSVRGSIGISYQAGARHLLERGADGLAILARVDPPARDLTPADYLDDSVDGPWGLDITMEVLLDGEAVSRPPCRTMYWTAPQMVAHMTVNGASLRPGDFFGSGTVSGDQPNERGSLMELSWSGTEPLKLADGREQTFLEDGQTVTLRGTAPGESGSVIDFGECVGTIVPATS
ncbi:fumarylacetoacetate hydrolase family protein [Aeromicrobium sp.]|uniref:fumarylacetoacetate hydrolase family protein n=1 Tax=Aeromicrobium sp. TaxID=1871063 RepID=UPI0019CD6055|nr:fumarylacetoacetate hydrolase family protein [Aeromicrobium sp.]MBC7633796.1 fumarylacetoacetate hydrolase family protein [Aeromicrobium sp.]